MPCGQSFLGGLQKSGELCEEAAFSCHPKRRQLYGSNHCPSNHGWEREWGPKNDRLLGHKEKAWMGVGVGAEKCLFRGSEWKDISQNSHASALGLIEA